MWQLAGAKTLKDTQNINIHFEPTSTLAENFLMKLCDVKLSKSPSSVNFYVM